MPQTMAAPLVWRAAPRRARPGLLVAFVVAIAASGCNPLPGDTMDPVYGRLRGERAVETAPAPTATPPAQESTRAQESSPPPRQQARATPPDAGAGRWVGRYVDSRGSGDITFALVRREDALSGTWTLRTGGGGTFNGRVGTDGRVTFRMQSGARDCPGTLEGWLEIRDIAGRASAVDHTLAGAYHGQDCEGVISDGRLDARRK